jgi:hypothetical protein
MQSKRDSFLEQVANIGSGFIIACLIWQFGINPAIKQGYLTIDNTLVITSIFTITSLIRGYVFRRIGNHFTQKQTPVPGSIESYRAKLEERKREVCSYDFK